MMFGQPNLLPEQDEDSVKHRDLKKRARYLRRFKDVLWSRWTGEYIKSLRERHTLNHKKGGPPIQQRDVVLIQSNERNHYGFAPHELRRPKNVVSMLLCALTKHAAIFGSL